MTRRAASAAAVHTCPTLGSWAALALVIAFGCSGAGPSGSGNGTGGSGSGSGGAQGSGGSGGASGRGSGGSNGPGSAGQGSGGSSTGGSGSSSGGRSGSGGGSGGNSGSGSGGQGTGGSSSGGSGSGGKGGSGGGSGMGSGGVAAGGASGSVSCTITAQSTQATAIPTVGIVTWTTTLTDLTNAEIQFGPADTGTSMTAPVNLKAAGFRTLLLGMKGSRSYVYRVVATSAAGSCTSQDYMLTTGAVPSTVPKPTATIVNAAAHARGFIVTTGGIAMGASSGNQPAYIMDADGDVVWWSSAPASASRAHMSWDGQTMWMMALNVENATGELRKVGMDGSSPQNNWAALTKAHHDFTVLPEGGIATMLWNTTGMDAHCSLVEYTADGQSTVVVPDFTTLYTSNTFHSNAIHYYAADDSYTVSDRNVNAFVKITRKGELQWQLGGTSPKGNSFKLVGITWQVNHGHQLLPNGNFLFFNNGGMGGMSAAIELELDTTAWTATKGWSYQASGVNSSVLGDTERLSNGNTLVTFSTAGTIHEVDSNGKLVMSIKTTSFGYADFRPSLYGPPPR